MKTLAIVPFACSVLLAASWRMTEAIDDLGTLYRKATDALDRAFAAIAAFIVSAVPFNRQPDFAFDGPSFNPTPAHYDAPPQSFVRHESHVSRRSAARGV